jgi:hypothetical protein
MESSRAYRQDGTKKFWRSTEGRKLKRQRAKSRRESQSTSTATSPQSSTTQLSLPLQPATLAPSNDPSPSMAFSLPLKPATSSPPDNLTPNMAFSLPMRPATLAPSNDSTPNMAFSLPMRPAAVAPASIATLSVPAPRFAQAPIAQAHPFFGLPADVGTKILSHLRWNQISASRRCCQQFHGLVVSFERHHAEPRIASHIRCLQNKIDTLRDARMPTNANSLLDSLRIWTSTRGTFHNHSVSLVSLNKWFCYLASAHSKEQIPPFEHYGMWTLLAVEAVHLQHRVGNLSWAGFQRHVRNSKNLLLDQAENKKLYDRIVSTVDLAQRDIMLPIWSHDKEILSFLGCRLHRFRITPIRVDGDRSNPQGKLREPQLAAEITCGYIGVLPDLPGPSIFCYYASRYG